MSYFRELPNIEYQSFLSDAVSSQDYIKVKNIFRRNKVRDDLKNVFTLFNKYEIVEGARPDIVAEEFYGDAELDWVVLLTAGIQNVRNEWPLSNYQLYRYAEEKYGTTLNDVHHYETKEIKDSTGKILLRSGLVVDETFTFSYSNSGNIIELDINSRTPDGLPTLMSGISNFAYETRKNVEKSSIRLLKKQYLQQFLNDMRDIMIYQKSSEYVNEKLVRVENTKNRID